MLASDPEMMTPLPRVGLMLVGLAVVSGCGVVGLPVAPEYVGIGPLLEKNKQQEVAERERAAKQQPVQPVEPEAIDDGTSAAPEDEVALPPLRPVGGR